MMKSNAAYLGLLTAIALMLSYIEMLIPFQPGVPGMKLGLANLAVLLCLYLLGWKDAFLLAVVKACISGLLFGNLYMIVYSLAGAVISVLVMIFLWKKDWFHIPIVSAAGGVAHNMGQLAAAFLVTDTYWVFFYAPALIIAGLATGLTLGGVAALALPSIQKVIRKGGYE